MDKRSRVSPSLDVLLPIAVALGLVAVGVLLGWLSRDLSLVQQRDQLSAAIYAISAVLGTMAGFVVTAMVFLGGASGSAIERLRAEIGVQLPVWLGLSVAALFLASITCALAGLFSNGWGARGLVIGCILVGSLAVGVVTVVLTAAFVKAVRPSGRVSEDK